MRKSASIIKLQELNLNTLAYFITQNKAELIHYLGRHAHDKLSMRTERGDEFECPFYYMIPGEQLLPIALKHLDENYKLILSPSLDIKGCLAFGTVAYGEKQSDCMEFVLGEGKVREVYSHPQKKSVILDSLAMVPFKEKDFPGAARFLNTIYRDLKEICWDEVPCCIEWSYYNRGVGIRNEPLIVWEMRAYA